jgi:hypothetical protein
MPSHEWPRGAGPEGVNPLRRNSSSHEVRLHRLGAALAEATVDSGVPAAVGMALDLHLEFRGRCELLGDGVENGSSIATEPVAARFKVDVPAGQEPVQLRLDTQRGGRRGRGGRLHGDGRRWRRWTQHDGWREAGAGKGWCVPHDAEPSKHTKGYEACPQPQPVRRAPRRAHISWCSRVLVSLAGRRTALECVTEMVLGGIEPAGIES